MERESLLNLMVFQSINDKGELKGYRGIDRDITDRKKVEEELKQIESSLAKLDSDRSQLVARINKNNLSKYERILYGKDGLAMVPVKNEACGGCHLNLPPQVINEIKMLRELIFCESCARILYIEE